MASTKTIIVTGANRGIGEAVAQLITNTVSSPLTLYATSRSGNDLRLKAGNQNHKIVYKSLDISDPHSIASLKNTIEQTSQPVDVVINNGGVNLDNHFSVENAHKTIDVNYRGTLAVCQAFLPLMRSETGRIVNLSSTGSSLQPFSSELRSRFRNAQSGSLDDVESLALEYEEAVRNGNDASQGWPSQRAYGVSKALINAMTGVLAKENPNIAINCCCPGWVDTDMGNQIGQPPKTPADGAKIPVKLALGQIDGISGRYWGNDSISSTADGKVQPW